MAISHINCSSYGEKMYILQDTLVRILLKSILHVEPVTLILTKLKVVFVLYMESTAYNGVCKRYHGYLGVAISESQFFRQH